MMERKKLRLSWVMYALVLGCVPALSGCSGFFVCQKASCPAGSGSGSTGSGNGDYVYVGNGSSSSDSITGYSVADGTLASLTGSPFAVSATPTAMAISPHNSSLLYMATTGGGIYGFTISSSGSLSSISSNSQTILGGGGAYSTSPSSMAVSPDGQWLFVADSVSNTMAEYGINSSTSLLTLEGTVTCATSVAGTATQVRVSPDGQWVVCASGLGGDVVYPLTTSSGALGTAYAILTGGSQTGDFAIAMDASSHLFVARTGSLMVYSLSSSSAAQVATVAVGSGTGYAVVLDPTYSYVYDANFTDGAIYGFSINSSLSLTALSSSPYTAPSSVRAMAMDSSAKYMIAEGYNSSNGIQLYSIASGVLTAITSSGTAASGTSLSIPAAIAAQQ